MGVIVNIGRVTTKKQESAAYWLETYLPALDAGAREKLARLAELHNKYNRRAGLSAPQTPQQHVIHMVLDSLQLVELLLPAAGTTLADVGAGGGYPGLPVAITRGDMAVTLLEPNKRKAAYLELACRELDVANVAVKACRAQEDGGRYDLVTAKALGKPAKALKILFPLAKAAGRIALFMGAAATEMGGGPDPAARYEYRLPGYEHPRALWVWPAP